MKNKLTTPIKILLAFVIGLISCYFLYFLVDTVFNGFFADWFTRNFTYELSTTDNTSSITINWPSLKTALFITLIIMVALISILVVSISQFYARHKVKASITQAGQLIRTFMGKDDMDAAEIFPEDYLELSSQMIQLKTSLNQQQQTLQDETRRKDDLITYLAHDLKTPLTSVIGYLSLLDEIPEMPAEQRQRYLQITLNKAIRLEDLINEFFEIIRYNLQQVTINKEPIDLQYMLVQMTDEFYPLLAAGNNTINLNAKEGLTVYGDPAKLARVFNNILKNAIAYSYPDSAITVNARIEQQQAVITFQNRGKTIPSQKLRSIFEKFYRLDEARATNTGGAGLGLAIAKDIVTLHDGTISVSSVNELTVFTVRIPSIARNK
ncbi:MAG: sensor histidine kinase [Lachnospiraceae bacterium]